MDKFFGLLTIVSNYTTPGWAKIAIQISMWIAVASQIFLLIPDMIHVIKTKDTRENKGFKGIIGFICSSCGITYSILLTWEEIPILEIIGLGVSELINLICLFIIYGVKINNMIAAKKINLTEPQLCSLLHTVSIAKRTLPKNMKNKLKKACKNLSLKEQIKLYIDALHVYNIKNNIKRTAKKVAKRIIKRANKKRV